MFVFKDHLLENEYKFIFNFNIFKRLIIILIEWVINKNLVNLKVAKILNKKIKNKIKIKKKIVILKIISYFNAYDYECVFTQNASGALKIIGESFPFNSMP